MKFNFIVLSTALLFLQGCASTQTEAEKIEEWRAFMVKNSTSDSQKPINEFSYLNCMRVASNMLNYECDHGIRIVLDPTLSQSGYPDDSDRIQNGDYNTADYFSDDVGSDLKISYSESSSVFEPNKVSPVLRFLPSSDKLKKRCHNINVTVSYAGESVTHAPYVIEQIYKSHRLHGNTYRRGSLSKPNKLQKGDMVNDTWYQRYYHHYNGDMSEVPMNADKFRYNYRPINVYMLEQNDRTLFIKYTLNCMR